MNQSQSQSQQQSQPQQSQHRDSLGSVISGNVINIKDIENDLNELFSQLRIDNQNQAINQQISEADTIDQSTLMALLLYLGMDTSNQEFFNYIQRTLESLKMTTITRANFKKMLLQPEISFQNLKNDEMTNIFKVFDRQQKGSFSGEDFIFYYKQTPEYAEMDAQQQAEILQRIMKDFEIINPDHKEITPIEFFKIISHQQE